MLYLVINSLGRGGAERSILQLFEELRNRNIPVKLLTLRDEQIEYPVPPKIMHDVVRLRTNNYLTAAWKFWRAIAQDRDPVFFSLMPQSNIISVLIGRLRKAPIFTSERSSPTLYYGSGVRLYAVLLPHLLSSRPVFISNFAVEKALPANVLGRRLQRRAAVLHNPVVSPVPLARAAAGRLKRFQALRAAMSERGIGSDAPPLRLLIASRLSPGKGILEFIRANSAFLLTGRVHLSIAGEGPLHDQIAAEIERCGLFDVVNLLGYASDIHAVYETCDVVLLVSDSEGFGRVGFEAYMAGCIVLGLEQNSFIAELLPDATAWASASAVDQMPVMLSKLAEMEPSPEAEDIARLREALGVGRHADSFLDIIHAPRIRTKG